MKQAISVQKFGSSVLRDEADLTQAVHAIYADLRLGRRVVAVVSAIGATTDRLLAEARATTEAPDARVLARLLATGEARAAALLALALERAGLPVALLGSENAGIVTEGDLLDARPIGLDEVLLRGELAARSIVVLPGFVGRRADGELTLLGRGGSDLSAVFVAGRLGAERCVLFKDVAGIFEWDPSDADLGTPRRFAVCSYADALELSGGIVQHKAVAAARELGLAFEVGGLDAPEGARTWVGPGPSRFEATSVATRPLRVGLLGLGTVGGGVYEHLLKQSSSFEVTSILVRDRDKHVRAGRAVATGLVPELVTADPEEFFRAELDLVVEALGGEEPAGALLARALEAGLHVVSANKAALAAHGQALRTRATEERLLLLTSAAVGGVVPMLEAARRVAASGPWPAVTMLEGVLNGTSSFVLDRLAEGEALSDAVLAAQDRGLAEADPGLDLDGTDVAHKLELLARATFGDCELVWTRKVGVEAAETALFASARACAGSVKLVARAVPLVGSEPESPRVVHLEVAPMVLAGAHPLASLRGAGNGVSFDLPGQEPLVLFGEGAGRWPTAESVVGDLLEVLAHVRATRAEGRGDPKEARR